MPTVPVVELTRHSAAILAEGADDALVVEGGQLTELGRAFKESFAHDLTVAANRMPNPEATMRQIIAVLPELWAKAAAKQAGAGA